jgi:hypothetical protein
MRTKSAATTDTICVKFSIVKFKLNNITSMVTKLSNQSNQNKIVQFQKQSTIANFTHNATTLMNKINFTTTSFHSNLTIAQFQFHNTTHNLTASVLETLDAGTIRLMEFLRGKIFSGTPPSEKERKKEIEKIK